MVVDQNVYVIFGNFIVYHVEGKFFRDDSP